MPDNQPSGTEGIHFNSVSRNMTPKGRNPLALTSTSPGMPWTHPANISVEVDVNANILQYYCTLFDITDLAPQKSPKYAILDHKTKQLSGKGSPQTIPRRFVPPTLNSR